jgi:AmmeMemoRadiSam system protein A
MPFPPVDELAHRARPESAPESQPVYSCDERSFLVEVARQAIAAALEKRDYHPQPPTPNLSEPRGVFVTLHLNGELRGCVGQIVASEPLATAVAHSAVSAAFCDPRFMPLSAAESPLIQIEISVLSPLRRILSEEIVIGVHGLLVMAGARRGLLLPQVATEFGWGVEMFLEQTCRKAGLAFDSWKQSGCEIYGFTTEKFGE